MGVVFQFYCFSFFFKYQPIVSLTNTYSCSRSKIQGLGLYAARDIEKNNMIIEYIGEIIRSELSEVIVVGFNGLELVLGDISISYHDILQISKIVWKFLNIAIFVSILL